MRLIRKSHIRLLNNGSELFRSAALPEYSILGLFPPTDAALEDSGFRDDLVYTTRHTVGSHEFGHRRRGNCLCCSFYLPVHSLMRL